jgi:DUF4097 and DUF4098 domain-containing protein YvlB
VAPRASQGRGGAAQSDRFSYRGRIGRDGRFSLTNVEGDIVITGGSGDEVQIDAIKQTRGSQTDLNSVNIDVDSRDGRIDVRTRYADRSARVSVAFTVTLPAGASVEVRSVSGNIRVTDVSGPVRAETVSGNVTAAKTPRLEAVKSVSGNVDLTDAGADADLAASTVSGSVRARSLKVRSLQASTVSGSLSLDDIDCSRVGLRTVSGNASYSGPLARNGRYDFSSHSGTIRLGLPESTGFDLTASTFSGSVRSDLPLTIGGNDGRGRGRQPVMSRRRIQATYGDGSAVVTVRTFSGDIVISKR